MESYLSSLVSLRGKTALITGGTRGIGRALAIALASAGADIILLVRDIDAGLPVLETIKKLGCAGMMYQCDLSERDKVLKIIPLISNHGDEIDIFIHCAGLQHRCPAEDFPDKKWDDILNVNVTAGFQISRELAKHWFNTGLKGYISRGRTVQEEDRTASKGAIAQLTKALNNEWMHKGINVNAIATGYIETELTSGIKDGGKKEKPILQRIPPCRWGTPADLAGAVIHLCAKSGDYIGEGLHAVDGGFLGK